MTVSRKTRFLLFIALGLCALAVIAAGAYAKIRYDVFIVPTTSMEPTIGKAISL